MVVRVVLITLQADFLFGDRLDHVESCTFLTSLSSKRSPRICFSCKSALIASFINVCFSLSTDARLSSRQSLFNSLVGAEYPDKTLELVFDV